MKIHWQVDKADIAAVQTMMSEQADNAMVMNRRRKNVEGPGPTFNRDTFWHALVSCLLTTQQRSGPTSAVTRILSEEPFQLSLDRCTQVSALELQGIIRSFGGLRRGPTIADQIITNLRFLADDGWATMEDEAAKLFPLRQAPPSKSAVSVERAAALVAQGFRGVGPKQSRNLWQLYGLTRFEIPIDSRIGKWLRSIRFPVPTSVGALGDEDCYQLVSDGVQALCEASGVLPCMLDAAVFASFDGDGWTPENSMW
jgi:hypothetical protein